MGQVGSTAIGADAIIQPRSPSVFGMNLRSMSKWYPIFHARLARVRKHFIYLTICASTTKGAVSFAGEERVYTLLCTVLKPFLQIPQIPGPTWDVYLSMDVLCAGIFGWFSQLSRAKPRFTFYRIKHQTSSQPFPRSPQSPFLTLSRPPTQAKKACTRRNEQLTTPATAPSPCPA